MSGKKRILKTLLQIALLLAVYEGDCQTHRKETIILSTVYGNMKIKLFKETPLHSNNFLKLVKEGFYDSLLFHRVINHFMIQGGDPDSKTANDTVLLGNSDVGYWLPAEFKPKIYHKKGRLCAARESDDLNPNKESSGCQFYIVMGKTYDSLSLHKAEVRVNKALVNKINYNVAFGGKSSELKQLYIRLFTQGKDDSLKWHARQLNDPVAIAEYFKSPRYTFNKEQKQVYATIGGTPHLDNNYTVFGEVVEGIDIIDKIAGLKTDKNDRPLTNVRMKLKLIEK